LKGGVDGGKEEGTHARKLVAGKKGDALARNLRKNISQRMGGKYVHGRRKGGLARKKSFGKKNVNE